MPKIDSYGRFIKDIEGLEIYFLITPIFKINSLGINSYNISLDNYDSKTRNFENLIIKI